MRCVCSSTYERPVCRVREGNPSAAKGCCGWGCVGCVLAVNVQHWVASPAPDWQVPYNCFNVRGCCSCRDCASASSPASTANATAAVDGAPAAEHACAAGSAARGREWLGMRLTPVDRMRYMAMPMMLSTDVLVTRRALAQQHQLQGKGALCPVGFERCSSCGVVGECFHTGSKLHKDAHCAIDRTSDLGIALATTPC